ncbi:hypothetical protein ACFTWH_15150 [Streptomyces sp. NPDC057011]|uniref:hypothetical protein n=1 Tax=unclassified Streptomyces TaxID=2593676 RepID=UPI0036373F4A
MKLDLPGASVQLADGTFAFSWHHFGVLDVSVARCTSLHTRAHGQQGEVQLIFQFRPEAAGEGASGMVMVRVDVPTQHAASAVRFITEARARYDIAGPADDGSQEDTVSRIPRDDRDWITGPTNADSEELYGEIFDRIRAEPAA